MTSPLPLPLLLLPSPYFFISSYLYYASSRIVGSRHYIGKRDIFVCCRDCRDCPVFAQWGNSSFFAYPLTGGGVNLLILILNYLRFDSCVLANTYTRSNTFGVIDLSVLLALPYLKQPQRLWLRTPPSNKVGESVLVVLTLDRSARSIFHWVKGYLVHIHKSHYCIEWWGIHYPLVRDRALSVIRDTSSRKHHTARPQYIPSSLPAVFSVSFL